MRKVYQAKPPNKISRLVVRPLEDGSHHSLNNDRRVLRSALYLHTHYQKGSQPAAKRRGQQNGLKLREFGDQEKHFDLK
jgi:hypothetical protein